MMKNFDVFVGVDWSGAKSINTKSIALAVSQRDQNLVELLPEIRSRTAVVQWIEDFSNANQRILIGIDCNFGYAQKIGIRQFGNGYDYRDVWSEIERICSDTSNYYAGAFWQHPQYSKYFWEEGKMPKNFEMPRRLTETICGETGIGWPESPFKLIGAKQVGKGGLAGMRMAFDLKARLQDKICIWPFEHDIANTASIVITEIYPRQFIRRAGLGNKKLNQNTLNQALNFFKTQPLKGNEAITDHDTDALVSAAGLRYLCGDNSVLPKDLAWPKMLDQLRAKREGWIFGVGYA